LTVALTTGSPSAFAADVFASDISGNAIAGSVTIVVTSNQGTATVSADTTARFVGFIATAAGEIIQNVTFKATQPVTGVIWPSVDNVYVGAAGFCRLDMDGDNLLSASKEGLVLLRSMLGMSGAAVVNGTGITLAQWNATRTNLNTHCGANLVP